MRGATGPADRAIAGPRRAWQSWHMLALFALLLVVGATVAWSWCAWRVRIPHNRLGFVAAWSLGTLLAAIVLVNGAPGTGLAVTALILGGVILALYASAPQRTAAQAIAVGDAMPAFRAEAGDGTVVDSADYAGQPLLLKFFRGHW